MLKAWCIHESVTIASKMLQIQTRKSDKHSRTHIQLAVETAKQLDDVGKQIGRGTRPKIIKALIESFARANEEMLFATYENVVKEGAPICITGRPYSGKSETLDLILRRAQQEGAPFLLFNSVNRPGNPPDHGWISKTIGYYEIASLKWLDKPDQYSVLLEQDPEVRKSSIREISKILLRCEADVRLKDWIIAVEEAHEYWKIEPFNSVLRRMRKCVKKLIVISTEPELFRMCEPMRPVPREVVMQSQR